MEVDCKYGHGDRQAGGSTARHGLSIVSDWASLSMLPNLPAVVARRAQKGQCGFEEDRLADSKGRGHRERREDRWHPGGHDYLALRGAEGARSHHEVLSRKDSARPRTMRQAVGQ